MSQALATLGSLGDPKEAVAQTIIDDTVEFWMDVSDKSGVSLPDMRNLGTEYMAELAMEHKSYRIGDPAMIEPILREPEFHS